MKVKMLLLLLALLCLVGCKGVKTEEKQNTDIEPIEKVDVREEKDKVVIQAEQGKMEISYDAGQDLDLPEGFPAEKLPVYPKGSIVVSECVNNVYNVGIVTNDNVESIYKYYKKNLNADSITSDMLSGESANLFLQDGEKVGAIMIMPNNLPYDFKYVIFITYGE